MKKNLNYFQFIRGVEKAWFSDTKRAGFADAHTAPYRKMGFTLAEVLITLGIIGVVAAMTLPALIQRNNERAAVSQLKKVHVTLESAYRLAQNEHSEVSNWFTTNDLKTNSEIFYKNLKPYLKVLKECGFEEGCLTPGPVKTLDGRDYNPYNSNPSEYRVILADGTALVFYLSQPNCKGVMNMDDENINWEVCGNIKVDINGRKGEYTIGKDFFFFNITAKGIVPVGIATTATESFEQYCNRTKRTNANGRGCTAWVIYNENMDYLHCDDLSWKGKTKCK